MMRRTMARVGTAAVLAGMVVGGATQRATADLGGAVSYTEPRGVLLMPFDATANHESFQLVSRIGTEGGQVVASHWSYWAADCRHLADVFICLTEDDTVVVDPKALRGEIQSFNPPQNNPVGPSFNLSGERGFVTVSAFAATTGPSGLDCRVVDPDGDRVDTELVGAWTIADTSTNAAFGNDAIGLDHDELPDPTSFLDNGIICQTFNPETLGDSDVILIGVEIGRGNGRFREFEIGPIRNRGTPAVCCDLSFTDNLENLASLPDLCFGCAHFAPISGSLGPDGLIPASVSVDSSGFVHLTNCATHPALPGDCASGTRCPPSEHGLEQFIFAVHGQAVGQFGTVVSCKYTEPCPGGLGSQAQCPPR